MRTSASRVSLADLSAAGIRLRPVDASTIARELTLRVSRGELPGIPSPHVIRFTADGEIFVEGPVAAGSSPGRAARLLDAMLPPFDAPVGFRVPGALRLVVARALRTLDVPPYSSTEEFADAVARFSSPDAVSTVREIVSSWHLAVSAQEPPEVTDAPVQEGRDHQLTVSDVRRARRATGLTLMDVAARSRIPISLLRELEWGDFINWPSGPYGRAQLICYARAAGLDEQVVLDVMLPQLATTAAARRALGVNEPPRIVQDSALVLPQSRPLAIIPPPRRSRWLAALAIPAVAAILLVPAAWRERANPVDASANPPASVTPAAANRSLATDEPEVGRNRPAASAAMPGRRAEEVLRRDPQRNIPSATPALRATTSFSPAFASAGSAMFYHVNNDSGSSIMRADTDSSGAVLRITSVVNDTSKNFHARPSPDGRLIAFDSDREGERAVYVAGVDGRNVHRITGEGFAAVPSWSPDGSQLAYVRAEPNRPNVWNLWATTLDTGETRRLTSYRVGQPWGAAWFPDGRTIAFSHEDRLIVRALDEEGERVYRSPLAGRLLRTPAVSPDGRRIIFQVFRDGAWLLDLSDGSMRRILSDPTAEEFTWSPDGRRVAYHSRQTGRWGVWIMAPR